MFKGFFKKESGQSMVLVALMFVVLFGFGALAIDIGYMTYQKSELQNAADAAALAGAGSIPTGLTKIEIEETVVPEYISENVDQLVSLTLDNATALYYGNEVQVTLKQKAPDFLGGILTSDPRYIEVSATALYIPGTPGEPAKEGNPGTPAIPASMWTGEALPFINLKDNVFTPGIKFDVWDKVAEGNFSSIENFEIVNEDKPSELYFTIDLDEGLQIKNGVVATKQQAIEDYYNTHKDKIVYIFSISPTAMANNEVNLTDGTVKQLYDKSGKNWKLNLDNKKDYVDISSLVLIECTFDGYDKKTLTLTTKKVYDIGKDELPIGYTNPAGEIPAQPGTPGTPAVPEGKATIKLIN